MPLLSPKMRRLYADSIASAVFALMLLGFAVLFTFADDWCREHHRPAWLTLGFRGLSILLFVTDGIAITCVCLKVIIESVRETFWPT